MPELHVVGKLDLLHLFHPIFPVKRILNMKMSPLEYVTAAQIVSSICQNWKNP